MSQVQIATPISHLFADSSIAKRVEDASDCLEGRDHQWQRSEKRQYLFHCEIQLVHHINDEDLRYLEAIRSKKTELKLISFHAASNCDQPVLKDGMFFPGGVTYDWDALVKKAVFNIDLIRKIFGPGVQIAIENNNYFPTPAYGIVTDPRFLTDLVSKCGLSFLFDLAHAKVSAHNLGVSYDHYCSALPLTQTKQIHLCRPSLPPKGMARDVHELPTEEDILEVLAVVRKFSVEYLTVEYYRDSDRLIDFLRKLRERIAHEFR